MRKCENTLQKLSFVHQKVIHYIVAANALARSGIVAHSNAASFSIKTILYETKKNFWQDLLKTRQNEC